MKKLILIFTLIFALGVSLAFADDGGSYKPEDWSYGNIYVKEPNDKIALEQELLVVEQTGIFDYREDVYPYPKIRGKEINALFNFKNTTKETVTVPCAFPVVLTTQFAVKNDGSVSNYVYFGNGFTSDESVLSIALQKKVKKLDYEKLNVTKEEFFALNKKLATVSASDYVWNLSQFGIENTVYKPIEITQDEKKVPILTVGIETTVEKDEEMNGKVYRNEKFYKDDEIYTLKLVLHFYHELQFSPSARSYVRTKYSIETEKRSRHTTTRKVFYDISTGGTWKGSIGDFLLLTDSEMTSKNSICNFDITNLGVLSSGCDSPFYLHSAKNYNPKSDEYFEFEVCDPYRDGPSIVNIEEEKKQSFVTNVRSSSALSGTYKIAGKGNPYWDDVDEKPRTSTYDASTSFDGNFYNGWVEGVSGSGEKGAGIGEWIEFTLTKGVIGPFATNGLRRYAVNEAKNWWKSNNRVCTMTLLDSNGKKVSDFVFYDLFPEFKNEYSGSRIAINSVENPFLLEKGTYRLRLDSVYSGEKWNDTVLGEVWFIPLSDLAEKIIFSGKSEKIRNEVDRIIFDYVSNYIDCRMKETER